MPRRHWHNPSLRVMQIDSLTDGPTASLNMVNICHWFPGLVELALHCSDLKKTLLLMQEPLLKLQKLSNLKLRKKFKDFVVFKIKDGKLVPTEVAVGDGESMEFLASGTVERLHLSSSSSDDSLGEIFRSHDSVCEILLEASSLLWSRIRLLKDIILELRRSLLLTTQNGTQIEFRRAGTSRDELQHGSFQLDDTVIQVRSWTERELVVDADDFSVALLGRMARRISGSIQSLDLDMSMLTNEGVNVMQQAVQDIRPNEITFSSDEEGHDEAYRAFINGLHPEVWSRLSRLCLRCDFVDKWIRYLDQYVNRISMSQLQQLDLRGGLIPLSIDSSSVAWIVDIVSPTETGTPLQKIFLRSLLLEPDDWALLINAIDLSALRSLTIANCNWTEANTSTLRDRIKKEATFDDLDLQFHCPSLRLQKSIMERRGSGTK
ncbi:hypothetical protein EC968_008807 [Mortierella alpina]|nr:hypothetical protein EC968_008807 [Mortierella alpina]